MTDAINDCKRNEDETIEDLNNQIDSLTDEVIRLLKTRKFLWESLKQVKNDLDVIIKLYEINNLDTITYLNQLDTNLSTILDMQGKVLRSARVGDFTLL